MVEDLRSFIKYIKTYHSDDFLEVNKLINPKLELSAVITKLEEQRRTPIVLFNNVKGTEFPTIVNVNASRKRIAAGMKTDLNKMREKYLVAVNNPIQPKYTSSAPVQDIIVKESEVDLFKLPQLIFHKEEGGAYISAGIVTAKDPETGIRNSSYNRLMIQNKNHLGIYMTKGRHLWEYYTRAEAKNEALPISIHIGSHPAWSSGILFTGEFEVDELSIAGGILGQAIPIVKCKTVDADVPAYSEICLEAELLPKIREDEGPFIEFTGYTIGKGKREVVKVKSITHRKNAIYQTILSGAHYEHLVLGTVPMEVNLLNKIKNHVPTVQDVHFPTAMTVFVSIKKKAEGQGKSAILAALGSEFYSKNVVVVDHDINIRDPRQVWWAIGTRVRSDQDIIIVPGVRGSGIDPTTTTEGIITKLGIDATANPTLDKYPPVGTIPKKILDKIDLTKLFE